MLDLGKEAPDFKAESTRGGFVLSEAGSPVVLFYFPKAGSRVCTKEACGFRDSMAEFNDVDATVVGVSPNDSLEDLEEFAEENSLEFPLISDTDGEIADLYGIGGVLGLTRKMKRVTLVIDDMTVVKTIKGVLAADKHVEESLEAVAET
ncbi:MAG: peroxiredoxin [Halobacteria archaeon]